VIPGLSVGGFADVSTKMRDSMACGVGVPRAPELGPCHYHSTRQPGMSAIGGSMRKV